VTSHNDRDRIEQIRNLLGRLESTPVAVLTPQIMVQIAHAWRIIEAAESDLDASWRVEIRRPDEPSSITVGVGYHAGHGLDAERAAATLRYALHRAALRLLESVPETELYHALHALRPRLAILQIGRARPEDEDRWHVLMCPESRNGRPRIPINEEVVAATREEAEALARWNVGRRRSPDLVDESGAAEVVQAMWRTWETVDVRKILPTIFEVGEAVAALGISWPDNQEGRRIQRWLTAIAEQRPVEGTYVLSSRTQERTP
jgi:hypothetical protein